MTNNDILAKAGREIDLQERLQRFYAFMDVNREIRRLLNIRSRSLGSTANTEHIKTQIERVDQQLGVLRETRDRLNKSDLL